jgi:tape measure domain-containing protein
VAESNIRLRVDGRDAVQQLNRVNKAAGTLQGTVTKLVGAFGAIQAAKFVFFKTAELERQTKSLQVLTGSLGNAKNIIKELQQFGAVTPFTSSELIETAKRLKAFGFETEKVVDITKRLGDIAGATGADLGGIATAFGQIQAKGRLQGEELLQLQERGVDLQGTLRKEYDLTAEEFQKALSKGQVSAEAVNFALTKLTEKGGKYANGAIAQSDTLAGKFSTLQDGVDTLARRIGGVLSPVLKGVFDQAIQGLNAVNRLIAAGRGASFTRQIGAIGTKLTFGVTSDAVDDIEKVFGQLSSQKNKAGIQQNITALNQLSNALVRIKSNDPNAGRAVALQGQIMRRQVLESAALKNVPAAQSLDAIKIPELTGGNGGGSGGGSKRTAQLQQQKDISEAMFALEMKAQQARFSDDEILKSQVSKQLEIQKIMEAGLPPRKEAVRLAAAQNDHLFTVADTMREIIKRAHENNTVAVDGVKSAFAAARGIDIELEKQAEKMNKIYGSIGKTITTGIVDSLTAAVDGTKSLADVASNTLKSLANILMQFGINSLLGGLGGGNPDSIFTKIFGGGRASGGSVSSSRSYLVGERGPELFSPGRSGSIAPNGSMGGANVTVNVDASGTKAEGDGQGAKQLGSAIGAAVQAELIKQQRPGGLLSR